MKFYKCIWCEQLAVSFEYMVIFLILTQVQDFLSKVLYQSEEVLNKFKEDKASVMLLCLIFVYMPIGFYYQSKPTFERK